MNRPVLITGTSGFVCASPLDAAVLRTALVFGRQIDRLAGGNTRVSRVELGEAVAESLGLDKGAIIPCSRSDQPSPTPRPGDISLASAKLERRLGIRPATLADGLRRMKASADQ